MKLEKSIDVIHSYQNGCSWDRANREAKGVSTHACREFVHSVEPNWDSQRWAKCRYVCYLCTRETRRVSGPMGYMRRAGSKWGKARRATETDSGCPVEQQLGGTGPRPLALFRCMRGQGCLLRTSERSATLTSVPACAGAEFGLSTHNSWVWEGHGRVAAGPVVMVSDGAEGTKAHRSPTRKARVPVASSAWGGLADGADVGAAPLFPLTGARRLIGHLGKVFGKSSGSSLSHSLNIARSCAGKKTPWPSAESAHRLPWLPS